MDIISLLPHLALILTDIIAKLPDYVSRINGFALFQILNNFLVEFLPQTARGRGRVRDAKGSLVSTAVLGTLALLLQMRLIRIWRSENCSHWQIQSFGGVKLPCKYKDIYTHTHDYIFKGIHANKPLFSEINDHSHGSKTEQSQKNTDFQEGKKRQPPLPAFLFLLVLSHHYVKCIS